MRWLLLVLLGSMASACAEASDPIVERIDALRARDVAFVHAELPSPRRTVELFGDGSDARTGLTARLRADEDANAILDAGADAVASLVAMLDDPERQTLAAVFLAELGGDEAAAALLARWRALREARRTIYFESGGFHHEGVPGRFYMRERADAEPGTDHRARGVSPQPGNAGGGRVR